MSSPYSDVADAIMIFTQVYREEQEKTQTALKALANELAVISSGIQTLTNRPQYMPPDGSLISAELQRIEVAMREAARVGAGAAMPWTVPPSIHDPLGEGKK